MQEKPFDDIPPGRLSRNGLPSRRLFDQGELRLATLALLAEKPRHGYEIIKEISERVAGTYTPSPGSIYPLLVMLAEIGHVTTSDDDGKKSHVITDHGRSYLAAHAANVHAVFERMETVHKAHSDQQTPLIVAARERLRSAVVRRLDRGTLSEEEIQTIATILDAAADAVDKT